MPTGSQALIATSNSAGLTVSGLSSVPSQFSTLGSQLAAPITFPGITLPNATNLTPESICGILGILEAYPALLVNKLLAKIALLQRVASIVEQAGDLLALPILTALNGVENIAALTIDDYNAIRAACCFLNLPPVNDNNLLNLISQIQNALNELINFLGEHPWSQLNGLQDELDSLIEDAINSITGDISGLLRCINTLCNAASTIQSGLDTGNLTGFDSSGASYANILTPSQTSKSQQITTLTSQITTLAGAPVTSSGSFSVGPGATSAPATSSAATTTPNNTVTTDTSGQLYSNGVAVATPSTTVTPTATVAAASTTTTPTVAAIVAPTLSSVTSNQTVLYKQSPLPSGATTITITSLGLASIPLVFANVTIPTGGQKVDAYVRQDTVTKDGFTADLNPAPTGPGIYYLNYSLVL